MAMTFSLFQRTEAFAEHPPSEIRIFDAEVHPDEIKKEFHLVIDRMILFRDESEIDASIGKLINLSKSIGPGSEELILSAHRAFLEKKKMTTAVALIDQVLKASLPIAYANYTLKNLEGIEEIGSTEQNQLSAALSNLKSAEDFLDFAKKIAQQISVVRLESAPTRSQALFLTICKGSKIPEIGNSQIQASTESSVILICT